MSLSRTIVFLFLLAPLSFGANKDMQELQRDVAMLQDQVRNLQSSVDMKVAAMQALVQQTLDSVNRTNTAVAVMENRFGDAMKQQQQSVTAPVLSVTQKLDQMSEDFRAVRESVLDMNTRMGKLDAKMADLQNMINTIRTPPAAPPPPAGAPLTGKHSPLRQCRRCRPTSPTPMRFAIIGGGKNDLALQEFSDYLKYFSNTALAPNAQYYVGDIYYRKQDYADAVQNFDAVLEHYGDNNKTGDAQYMKGMSLLGLGKNDSAAREFRDVYMKYPDTEIAAKAKARLKELGLSVTSSRTRKTR